MQCKDVDDIAILKFLSESKDRDGMWANRCFGDHNDIRHAFPQGFDTPKRLVLAKMDKMIRKGTVDGCACGCRGDFVITPKGLEHLALNMDTVPVGTTMH